MDPTPPRKPKPPAVSPFYLKRRDTKTAAEIVSEAKEELMKQQRDKVRSIATKRPFTPRDDQRTLFGGHSSSYESRPASSFSLGPQHFDGFSESRPGSAARPPSGSTRPMSGTRLAPIDDNLRELVSPKPPPDPNRKRSGRGTRSALHSQRSFDNGHSGKGRGDPLTATDLTEYTGTPRSGSCGDLKQDDTQSPSRRVHSGPKERTDTRSASPTRRRSSASRLSERNGLPEVSGGESVKATHGGSADIILGERGTADGQEGSTSRTNSASKDTAVSQDDQSQQMMDKQVLPILEELTQYKLLDNGRVLSLCNSLYQILEQGRMLGKVYSRRSSILKTVFKLMDRTDPQVLLCLSRLILSLRVSGSNLASCCKLIFKVSKDKENDQLFLANNLLDLFLDAMMTMDSAASSSDALIYSCGAIKFLAGNPNLAEALSQKCTLLTLRTILHKLNKQNIDTAKPAEKLVQILSQITSVLRRFADNKIFISQFIYHSIIDELCVTSVTFANEYDIMLNLASAFRNSWKPRINLGEDPKIPSSNSSRLPFFLRVLEMVKLTIHEDCCEILHRHPSCYKSIIKLLQTYTHKEDLVLRFCFVLGNLAALHEEARVAYHNEKESIRVIIQVFEHYINLSLKSEANGRGGSASHRPTSHINDVLVKVIRVIANLSMSEQVGGAFSDEPRIVDFLTHIIEVRHINEEEELVLNSMATINNLSYFCTPGTALQENEIEIARVLLKMLLNDNREGMLESCRIYGNLTRSRTVRDFLACNSVLEIMTTLLDSGEQELVYNCCGVLVNFMCDEDKRPILKREGGINKLIEVLTDFSTIDWQLAGVVCQLLWNYSTKLRNSTQAFGDEQAQQLINLLNMYIDDPHIPEASSPDMTAYLRDTWRDEFCSVAAQLRKRIKTHLSQLEPLDGPA